MNIKDWKKFCALVDEYNRKGEQRCLERDRKQQKQYDKKCGVGKIIAKSLFNYIDKTTFNYFEWKEGKLKLN